MTATTEVQLYNLALSAAGARASVASISETSREAQLCALWYSEVRDLVLRAAPWPSTRAASRLNLIAERDLDEDWEDYDPPEGMVYGYDLPSTLLRPRYLQTYERFVLGQDQQNTKRLFTNAETAILVYTRTQTDITKWEHPLKLAIVDALAAYICRPLTGKADFAQSLVERANFIILQAQTEAANQDESRLESTPSWIAARGYSGDTNDTRYVYPSGPLLTLTGAPTT